MPHLGAKRKVDILIAWAVFAIALFVYNATLTPSLSYRSPDGNELATIPYILGLAHSTGYPLYTWLGKAFTFIPIGDVAHRMNLMSAVMAAGGMAMLYGIMMRLTEHRLVSAFTALFFAFSRTLWSQAVITEVYAPNIFMVTLTLLLLTWWARKPESALRLAAFALSFGLSLGTHMSNLGFAPAFAIFILLVDWRVLISPQRLIAGAGAFLLGCLQFLWLPFRASTLNDPFMLRDAPVTLEGIYRYTLGAFPQFKFAFPLWAIPDRIVLYIELALQQFGVLGIILGLYGMWEMCFRAPRRFLLLVLMYITHVFFFIQYKAFDIDVFFIPAHLIYAIFIGYGIYRLAHYAHTLVGRVGDPSAARLLGGMSTGVLAICLAVPIVLQVQGNWKYNDCSRDTAVNDFYRNVFAILPEGSVLLTRGGVFGYDAFYFRLVYNIRPDVIIPMLSGPRPNPQLLEGREVYSVVPPSQGRRRDPWAPPQQLTGPNAWFIPVLIGQGTTTAFSHRSRPLVLYRVSDTPPELVVEEASPQHKLPPQQGALYLVGYDVESRELERGGHIHLTLYWRVEERGEFVVETSLESTDGSVIPLESHPLGLGNLARYIREVHSPSRGIVVEDYRIVIPSHLEPGSFRLRVSASEARGRWKRMLISSADLGEFELCNVRDKGALAPWSLLLSTFY